MNRQTNGIIGPISPDSDDGTSLLVALTGNFAVRYCRTGVEIAPASEEQRRVNTRLRAAMLI